MRRAMAEPRETTTKKRRKGAPPWAGWAALGGLVAGLAALVLWSLPKGGSPDVAAAPTDAGDEVEPWHDEALVNGHGGGATTKPTRRDTLERYVQRLQKLEGKAQGTGKTSSYRNGPAPLYADVMEDPVLASGGLALLGGGLLLTGLRSRSRNRNRNRHAKDAARAQGPR